jgi:CheY-like chemotaxis protein
MSSRILIADDTITVLDFLEIVFARQGFEVRKAAYGEQALEVAQGEQPDVILLDVMMPGMDGLEVTRRLRADPRTTRIPILLYSAVVGDEIHAQSRAAGADDFLGKTVNHAELVTRVREWLAARSTPGGVGQAELIDVGLDLLHTLEAEWVWILGAHADRIQHLAICCERGEQQALTIQRTIGPGPFPLEEGAFWGPVVLGGEWRMNWPLAKVAAVPGGEAIAQAAQAVGAMGLSLVPLIGPAGERGALAFTPAPTLAHSRRSANSVAVAAHYASAALSLWGNLPRQPALGAGTVPRTLPRTTHGSQGP